MNNFFRALIAGYGAKKLGGGCFGTILVFILIWVALGQCSFSSRAVPPPETYPAKHQVCLSVGQDQFSLNIFEARNAKATFRLSVFLPRVGMYSYSPKANYRIPITVLMPSKLALRETDKLSRLVSYLVTVPS